MVWGFLLEFNYFPFMKNKWRQGVQQYVPFSGLVGKAYHFVKSRELLTSLEIV